MKANDAYRPAAHVVACEVANETILLDKEVGRYFGLDPTGSRVWQMISCGLTLAEICDRLEVEYEVARGRLEQDIAALSAELQGRKLIEPIPGSPA